MATDDSASRCELDAKTAETAARLDSTVSKAMGNIEKSIVHIDSRIDKFADKADGISKQLNNAKYWAIGTALAVLAIFVSVILAGFANLNSWLQYVSSN